MSVKIPYILPVILSGGIGTRLWPISREQYPKPFLKFPDGFSLLQKTYQRAVELATLGEVVLVINRDHFFHAKDECEKVSDTEISDVFISEPLGRGTAAAIGLAAQYALNKFGEDCLLLILPADHFLADSESFHSALTEAAVLASTEQLVTFGVKPSYPDSGYGYILAKGSSVEKFIEKPDQIKAKKYLANGDYLWNTGMFCMSPHFFLKELLQFEPHIKSQTKIAVANAKRSSGITWEHLEIQSSDFEHIKNTSIDYALMEKSNNISVVPCEIGWSDIGSWNEFGKLLPVDENQNNILAPAICQNTKNCIVHSSGRLIATLGVEDLIISSTEDAVLVANKNNSNGIRGIVEQLKLENNAAYQNFSTVHRSWGTYTVLKTGLGFKLKCIEMKPCAQLSLQSHKYRNEHWVVVSGTGIVTKGEKTIKLSANQSIYIPAGEKHRLRNPSTDFLVMIEVQCGSYLGEDDIVRYDDDYQDNSKGFL